MIENLRPKLRALDIRHVVYDGQPSLLLRDPLQLAQDKMIVLPQYLAPALTLCDGTRDISGLRASLAVRFGLRFGPGVLEQFVEALDEALLLDNRRSAEAQAQALAEYHQAPFRPPTLAGQSYPADADELRQLLDGYLDAVEDAGPPTTSGRGLVCPHIDYARGGPVYAQIWKRAAAMVKAADLVVLLGTDHYGDETVTLTRQHYATPFGVLPTAQEIVDALAEAIGHEAAFAGELLHCSEHSVELATVWLHHVRQGQPCDLVPIMCGSFGRFVRGEVEAARDPATNALVDTLRQTMAGRRVVVVAAADLSHVGPAFGGQALDIVGRGQLRAADQAIIERVCAGDADGFLAGIARDGDRYNVCGLPPIYLALRLLSPVQGEQVAYDRCPADQDGTSLVSVCGILFQ